MRTIPHPCGQRGISLLEVAVAIALLGVIVMMLLPALPRRSKHGAARIKCVMNLKQIALGYRVFANDHDDKFPFLVTNSLAYGNVTQAWLHFQAMSNECGSAKILLCPADRERLKDMTADFLTGPTSTALSLSSKSNRAVSFTASLDADQTLPNVILSSDRHLLTTSTNLDGRVFLALSNVTTTAWTKSQHDGAGNLALSDGSVQQVTSSALASHIRQQGIATNRLLLPLLP
ncbi:MAG: prepilin-type N-terminal cleavage/methylation domain-containing protein [Limisphaerales bacterium]